MTGRSFQDPLTPPQVNVHADRWRRLRTPICQLIRRSVCPWADSRAIPFRFHSNQNRIGAGLRLLHGSREFERVAGHDAIVMIGGSHQRGRVACARLDIMNR